MSKPWSRSRIAFAVYGVVLVLATGFFIGFVLHANQPETQAGGGGSTVTPSEQSLAATSTPPPSPTDTLPASSSSPVEVMDEMAEDLPTEATNPEVSNEPEPSNEQIWAYEQAYFTVDPVLREELMTPLATAQYLAEDLSREPVMYEGIEVRVVIGESEIVSRTVSDNRYTSYVVTSVFLETVRDDQVVNRFQGPAHSSAWINTVDGWRVIMNLGEQ